MVVDIPFPIALAMIGMVWWPVTLGLTLAFGALGVFRVDGGWK